MTAATGQWMNKTSLSLSAHLREFEFAIYEALDARDRRVIELFQALLPLIFRKLRGDDECNLR